MPNMTDAEREELRASLAEMRKFQDEHEVFYDSETDEFIDLKKTYLEEQNMMGWIYDVERRKYIRVKRVIWSKRWLKVHNLIAHPMLTIYRPFGKWLHEYTAKKMYRGPQTTEEQPDVNITAIMD